VPRTVRGEGQIGSSRDEHERCGFAPRYMPDVVEVVFAHV
jgi:hypothetical protein